eukprot:SAG11_NODE_343_length_10455_cov_7.072036_1_plen_136_part_00
MAAVTVVSTFDGTRCELDEHSATLCIDDDALALADIAGVRLEDGTMTIAWCPRERVGSPERILQPRELRRVAPPHVLEGEITNDEFAGQLRAASQSPSSAPWAAVAASAPRLLVLVNPARCACNGAHRRKRDFEI